MDEKKLRIALCGITEETNTFATETMGLCRITGNLSSGFERHVGQEIYAFKGSRS